MRLAGIEVHDRDVLDLATRLRDEGFVDLGERLGDAWRREVKIFALDVVERESIRRSLEHCPEGLAELRAVLLREHEGRVELGL